MKTVIANDPLALVWRVFRERHPDVQVDIFLHEFAGYPDGTGPTADDLAAIKAEHGDECEIAPFPMGACVVNENGGRIIILMDHRQPYSQMTETLAHELAHAVVGIEPPPHDHPHAHGPAWQAEYDAIQAGYMRLLPDQPEIPDSLAEAFGTMGHES